MIFCTGKNSMQTLIKNGTVVTARSMQISDVLIKDEKILNVERNIQPSKGVEVIDAAGLYVLPGGVDVHVHLDLEMAGTVTADDHYTGTKAAAFGGTTTVIDFVSQDSDDLTTNIAHHREKADPKVAIDYGLHANITHLTDEVEQQLSGLSQTGVTSIKVFTAYNNRLRLQDGEIIKVMRLAKANGLLTMLHAENGDVIELLVGEAIKAGHTSPIWHAKTRPAWGAAEALLRGAAFAAITNSTLYVVHMNTRGEVDQLEYARKNGVKVMGETCPQYLFFTDEQLKQPDGAKWVCSPPLRTAVDNVRLLEGIQSGVIQTIATDHCSFFFDGTRSIEYEGKRYSIPGKELGGDDFTKIPNGLVGVGDRMVVLWTRLVDSGAITPSEFVALTCTNPAKIFGMHPQKGDLLPGGDADIVLWDPRKEVQYGLAYAHHRTDHNLYEGWKLKGFPVQVISRGKTIVKDGLWWGRAGDGRFIHRHPNGAVL